MKKLVSLSLIACLILSLAACKGPADSTEPVKSEVEKSNSGADLIAATPAEAAYPLTQNGETLTMSLPGQGVQSDESPAPFTNKALDKAEEITGVTIEVTVTSASNGGMAMMMDAAAGVTTDLIWQPASYLLADEGDDVMILNDLMETYAPNYLKALSGDTDAQKAVVSDTGNALQFYTLYETPALRLSFGPVIRKDLLDGVGLTIPETYDELYNVLAAIKNTYSTELTLRLWPTGASSADWLSAGYGVSLGSEAPNYGFYVVDGTVKYGPLEEGFEQYVTMLNKWYTEGIINDAILDVMDMSSNSYLMDMSVGKSALFFVNYSSIATTEDMAELEGFHLEPIPDPVVNKGDKTHLAESRTEKAYQAAFAVSSACQYPELAVKWLDFWYGEEGQLLMNYGIEGESYTLDASGEPQYTDAARDAGRSSDYTLWNMAGILLDERFSVLYSEDYESVNAVWASNKDSAYMLPKNLMMEDAMAEDLTMMLRDVKSAADEGLMKFVVGDEPLTGIEDFRQELINMGASRCIEYYQVFYDNYMNR